MAACPPVRSRSCSTSLFFLALLSGLLGFLLGPQFVDGGGDLVLPGEFLILGRIVGGQVRDVCAELLQQGAGLVQFVALDVGFTVGPG